MQDPLPALSVAVHSAVVSPGSVKVTVPVGVVGKALVSATLAESWTGEPTPVEWGDADAVVCVGRSCTCSVSVAAELACVLSPL